MIEQRFICDICGNEIKPHDVCYLKITIGADHNGIFVEDVGFQDYAKAYETSANTFLNHMHVHNKCKNVLGTRLRGAIANARAAQQQDS